jgi:hypothetical protein
VSGPSRRVLTEGDIEAAIIERLGRDSSPDIWDDAIHNGYVLTEFLYREPKRLGLKDKNRESFIGFVRRTQTDILDIFPRTYDLLQWLNHSINKTDIFVSHSHQDSALAYSCLEYIKASIPLDPKNHIRLSSLPDYGATQGDRISQDAKEFIARSSIFIALITRNALAKTWVTFEMGAAWSAGARVFAVLAPDATKSDLPGPMAEYLAVATRDKTRKEIERALIQAAGDMARVLGLQATHGPEASRKLDLLVEQLVPSTA